MKYLGLGKTIFNSSVTLLKCTSGVTPDIETVLTERVLKSKYAGNWPSHSIEYFLPELKDEFRMGESRDVSSAAEYEEALDRSFPFKTFLENKKLTKFSSVKNPEIQSFGHHRAHAFAALAYSPFQNPLIIVLDGAGSSAAHLRNVKHDLESVNASVSDDSFECASVYVMENGKLVCKKKEFLKFVKGKKSGQSFTSGIGLFYEKISEFIFHSKHEAGKVMGLAPFGKRMEIGDYQEFLDNLDWSKQYQGKSKQEWENSPHLSFYQDLAATAQYAFEEWVESFFKEVRSEFPDYDQLVFTGGCALNCTTNWKIADKKIFKDIHVLPFPGDESIALGCAFGLMMEEQTWKPFQIDLQTSFLGPKSSVPTEEKIRNVFSQYKLSVESEIHKKVASEIADGKIVAWFQGRSECGPRSLGHRSILARPDRTDLKNYLNSHIKFRENFRPYGCTCIWEKAHEIFNVPAGFENPFMSFAVPVNEKWKQKLQHVTHVDGTSRMQTLHESQEPLFYKLLLEVEKLTGLPLVLNTSLNIMGEPILETIEDAERFFKDSAVDGLCIGNVWITK